MREKPKKATRKLVTNNGVATEDLELYVFALKILWLQMVPFLMIMVLSMIYGKWLEHYLFIIIYSLLRRYSGGFHFQKQWVCMMTSFSLLTIFCEVGARMELSISMVILCGIMGMGITLNSPLRFQISDEKYRNCQQKQCKRLLVIFMSCILLGLLRKYELVTWIGLGILMTRLLQYPCLIEHWYRGRQQNSFH